MIHTRIVMKRVWINRAAGRFSLRCVSSSVVAFAKSRVMSRVCNTHGTLDQCILSVKRLTCRDGLEDLGVHIRIDATLWIKDRGDVSAKVLLAQNRDPWAAVV